MRISRSRLTALINTAHEARERAYAPYSRFRVGAAVIGASGKVYTGCNVENASYGLSVCAERVAIFKAISEGETGIVALAVATESDEIARPCGACLQVMQEFALPDRPMMIAASAIDGTYDVYSLGGYLPRPFKLETPRIELEEEN